MADLYVNPGDAFPAGDYRVYDKVYLQNTGAGAATITFAAGHYDMPETEYRSTGVGTISFNKSTNNPTVTYHENIIGINFTSGNGCPWGSGTIRFRGDINFSGISSINRTAGSTYIFDKAGDQNIILGTVSLLGNVISENNANKSLNISQGVLNMGNANFEDITINIDPTIIFVSFTTNLKLRRVRFIKDGAPVIFILVGTVDIVNSYLENINAVATPFTAYNSVDGGGNAGITFIDTVSTGASRLLGVWT